MFIYIIVRIIINKHRFRQKNINNMTFPGTAETPETHKDVKPFGVFPHRHRGEWFCLSFFE